MFSIRSYVRSAPRAVTRLTSSALRTPTLRQSSYLQAAWKPSRTQFASAFSTSSSRRAAGDEELVQKLDAEIGLENEMKETEGVPTSVKDFLENGPFEVTDVPGEEEVVLTRKYEDET